MKKFVYAILMVVYSTLLLQFNLPYITVDAIPEYSIYYQPYFTLPTNNSIVPVINSVILIATFLFYYMGTVTTEYKGYGMYSVVRYQSRVKWYLKKICGVMRDLLVLVIIYNLISIVIARVFIDSYIIFQPKLLITQFLIFYFCILLLIQIQIIIEFITNEITALYTILIYFLLSTSLYMLVVEKGLYGLRILFFINNISMERSFIAGANTCFWMVILVFVNIFMIVAVCLMIRKKDII